MVWFVEVELVRPFSCIADTVVAASPDLLLADVKSLILSAVRGSWLEGLVENDADVVSVPPTETTVSKEVSAAAVVVAEFVSTAARRRQGNQEHVLFSADVDEVRRDCP